MTTAVDLQPLTDRQREVLVWIAKYIDANGYSPTIRQMCQAFNFASTEGAMCHLRQLRAKGWITWQPRETRTIRLTEEATNAAR